MNFFQDQDRARRNTNRLVALFAVAVAAIGVAIYTAVRVGLHVSGQGSLLGREMARRVSQPTEFTWWDPQLFAGVMACTVAFVGLASLFRILQLRKGGAAVAAMMGGRPVPPDARDPSERRLRNVVEEMALASGVPVPEVFLLEGEAAINAFAAGHDPADAAVAVTKGALDSFDRDQLQGVIAHEFSHVLNGDMRLNLRLVGVLYGILSLHVIGRSMMRVRWGRKGQGAAIAFAGVALAIIGGIGLLAGRLIQSAVSRQREFLADASAVQFTRNPSGIAGALKRILGHAGGSALASPHASEVGHLLFGEGSPTGLVSRLMATHPPLVERIRRIEPGFDPDNAVAGTAPAGVAVEAPAAAGFAGSGGGVVQAAPGDVVARVGRPDGRSLAAGRALVACLPAEVADALRDPEGATLVVFAVVLDADPAVREVQAGILRDALGADDAGRVVAIHRAVAALGPAARLPLVDLAAPALKRLAADRAEALGRIVESLVGADRRVSLFEFALMRLLRVRLRHRASPAPASRADPRRLAHLAAHMVASLARAGASGDGAAADRAFAAGIERLGLSDPGPLRDEWLAGRLGGLDDLGAALDGLARAPFAMRAKVVDAAAHCVLADGRVTVAEAELLRLVSASLDCPLPPFGAAQAPA
jgi:Zn-dependent protease with chaperone function